jgi:hemerythrin-like metal-binding protein
MKKKLIDKMNILVQLDWKDFLIGHANMDAQHAELINTINRLYKARYDKKHEEVECILEALVSSARLHFANEENEFMKLKYPKFVEHSLEHEDLIITTQNYVRRLKDENRIEGKELIELELQQFLFYWLNYHTRVSDVDVLKNENSL